MAGKKTYLIIIFKLILLKTESMLCKVFSRPADPALFLTFKLCEIIKYCNNIKIIN